MTEAANPVLLDERDDAAEPEPTMSVPDRADAPVSVITERFFRAIVDQVPLARIEELHLFSPLRQGGVETGIAVVAARVPVLVPAADVPELLLDMSDVTDADEAVEDSADATIDDAVVVTIDDSVDATIDVADDDAGDVEVELSVSEIADVAIEDATDVTVDDPADVAVVDPVARLRFDRAVTATDAPLRHTVYTARYRLVQKGPERGKWEADVVAEADAPLLTVEMVVRGVQRRAGEESETLRFSAPQLAHALQMPMPGDEGQPAA